MTPNGPSSSPRSSEHAGDDRVEGTLRRRQLVRVTGNAAEPGAAVLEHHAGRRRDDPGAERLIDALDKGYRHAIPIHHAQVGGAAARQARPEIKHGIRPYERATGGQALLGEGVGWQRPVADECVGVVEGELHRLDLEVRAFLEPLVQGQREQRRDPLAVRWQLAYLDTVVAPAERLDPLGSMGAEVVLGQPTRCRDRRRDLTLVERGRPLRRNPLQGGGELGKLVPLADRGRRPRGVCRPSPLVGDPRRAHDAVTRCLGCRSDGAVEAEAAEVRGQVCPEPDGTGHGHRPRTDILERPPAEVGRRPAGAVEPVQRALVPHERERVAADAVVGRLGNGQHRSSRESSVNRVPPVLERAQAGAGRERMTRRDHGLGADRGHAPPAARFGAARFEESVEVELHHASIARRGLEERSANEYTAVMSPAAHPFDVDETRRGLVAQGGGYEVVHSSPGLEIGVYVLVAPEPDRQQPHEEDEVYVVLEGSGVLEVEDTTTSLTEGMALFVAAGAEHRFTAYEQLALLVIFNGPHSG